LPIALPIAVVTMIGVWPTSGALAQRINSPGVSAPSIAAPSISAPSIAAPSIAAPTLSPSIAAPSLSPSIAAPSIQAPAVATPPVIESARPAPAAPRVDTYRVIPGYELNIRASDNANASILGRIPYSGSGIVLLGSCTNGWCPISYRGIEGWASARFLERE